MKKIVLPTLCLVLSANIADAQYSNASLDGPWIDSFVSPRGEEVSYIIFDGNGSITDFGIFDDNEPPEGSYTVDSTGSFSGQFFTINFSFIGQITSDTTASMVFLVGQDSISASMVKVMVIGAVQGNWSGQFIGDTLGTVYTAQITINQYGEIDTTVGFVQPVNGRFYSQSGIVAGHFYTGEVLSGWSQIDVDGILVGDSITGIFFLDWEGTGGTVLLEREPLSTIDEYTRIPKGFHLSQNYPNPFNPTTAISYQLPKSEFVNLSIYSVTGQMVETLVNEYNNAGFHTIEWNAGNVGSGLYFYRIESGEYKETKKCLILK